MDNKEDMRHETYKKDKEIKKTTIEIQENVKKTQNVIDKVNKELDRK